MSKLKKSRTAAFLSNKPVSGLPSKAEIDSKLAQVTGQDKVAPKVNKVDEPVPLKRVPLTTAISVEQRAKLEVIAITNKTKVADILHDALELYFENIKSPSDPELVKTFYALYSRKAK